MFVDYILNGKGFGEVGQVLAGCRFDAGLMRPYLDEKGRACVTVNTGRLTLNKKTGKYEPVYEKRYVSEILNSGIYLPVLNATSLRKDEWVQLDSVVLRAARARLKAWADLAAANTYSGFNGMSKLVLEHETMSDPGEAVVDMDGLGEGRAASPKFQLEGLPLPITHSDFWFSQRRLAVSRNTGTPLDTTMAEAAGRRVAEMIEKITIGVATGVTYGDASQYGRSPKVYGYTNFPARITKTDFTAPTAVGWDPTKTVDEILALRDLLYDTNFYGPFMLYHSKDWDKYMDDDYVVSGGNNPNQTLRQRLKAIDGIMDVKRLDFFTDTFSFLMVQMTSEVARAVIGQPITTVQWQSQGGMRLNFKVMAIMVPQLRADYNGNTGIAHGTTS